MSTTSGDGVGNMAFPILPVLVTIVGSLLWRGEATEVDKSTPSRPGSESPWDKALVDWSRMSPLGLVLASWRWPTSKLLVHDTGSLLVDHRDTEKGSWVATMAPALPSHHRGCEQNVDLVLLCPVCEPLYRSTSQAGQRLRSRHGSLKLLEQARNILRCSKQQHVAAPGRRGRAVTDKRTQAPSRWLVGCGSAAKAGPSWAPFVRSCDAQAQTRALKVLKRHLEGVNRDFGLVSDGRSCRVVRKHSAGKNYRDPTARLPSWLAKRCSNSDVRHTASGGTPIFILPARTLNPEQPASAKV
ncbi:hypothetical protein FBZ96_105665 [Bradyrhizobium stylosanthis]|uniref:Uncharacterized protein n=1 Tax=Bradyrhizobium stylosanthis TaxID=1803665 RepID=A0A560DPF3_9BRAD|nr:hypothetical protein FBZ96_105665 [Bradyrhizobium stylosanthis]